ncbi:hypothetical protein ADIMK_1259 [Marinobacterium lacunae]|uniref:diguanylate cyclase n=1 Tax=Marinobacterium lacunae TaxID=1232683 RepID=A0A081G201_9GAMM|nr:GGDEF domain-containing protein [Marinobacterium lacunae]KEA64806.1 hypothetical protein ADIMK_1259 [Marinobacterium lacunae]MBR9882870.1 GGDEF domain-containing protein [Oceanospirillales bacterium]
MTNSEIPDLMTSVRMVQQVESLPRLTGLMIASTTQADRRTAMVELNDRMAWIAHMTDILPLPGNENLLLELRETQSVLLSNIERLNTLVRVRIDGDALDSDLEEIQMLSAANQALSGKLSVQTGYFAAEMREQMFSQSSQLQSEIDQHQRDLFLLTLFVLLSTLLFALYFEFKVVRRILRMQRVVSKVELTPDELNDHGRDEITQLAETVKSYVQRIQSQEARMKQVHDELAFLAEHDSLTGLANRRHLYVAARRLLEQSLQPICVAVLDIDYFKQVNDRYGHANGDRALIHISQLIRDSLRDNDILARFGGEEFAAVLPVRSLEDTLAIFDKLCRNVSHNPVNLDGREPIYLTLSIGLTLVEPGTALAEGDEGALDALNAALKEADDALYEAKGSGRNKICLSRTAQALEEALP